MKPSGWPTWSPTPDGYGNMSSTKSLSPRCAVVAGSASGPAGFGVSNVWCSSHQSCQRASISCASVAEYRCGGVSTVAVEEWVSMSIPADQPTQDVRLLGPSLDDVRQYRRRND